MKLFEVKEESNALIENYISSIRASTGLKSSISLDSILANETKAFIEKFDTMKIAKANKDLVKQHPTFNSLYSYLTSFSEKITEERNMLLSALSHDENQSRSVFKSKRQAILSPCNTLQPPPLTMTRHLSEATENVPTWTKRESVNLPSSLKIMLPAAMSRKSETLHPPPNPNLTEDFSLSPHSSHLVGSSIRKFIFRRDIQPPQG